MTGWNSDDNIYYVDDEPTSLDQNGYGDYNNTHYSSYPDVYQGWDSLTSVYYIDGNVTLLSSSGYGSYNNVFYWEYPTTYTGWDSDTNTYYVEGNTTSLSSTGYGDYNDKHYSAYPTLYQGGDINNNNYYIDGIDTGLDANGYGDYNDIHYSAYPDVYQGWDSLTSVYYIDGNVTSLSSSGYGSYNNVFYWEYPTTYTGWDSGSNTYYIEGNTTSLSSTGYGAYDGRFYSSYPTLFNGYDPISDEYYVNGEIVEKVYGCKNVSAINYNPNANMNSGCIFPDQLPKYFLPNIDEWFKAAYYDPNKSGNNKYWQYSIKNDSSPKSICADAIGNGINCEDNGTCRPLNFNDICGCFKTYKNNDRILIDPTLNSNYNGNDIFLDYTGSGCDISSLPLVIDRTFSTLTINSSGSGPIKLGNIPNNFPGNKTLILTGVNIGENIVGDLVDYYPSSNGRLFLQKRGSGSWYLDRPHIFTGTTLIKEGILIVQKSSQDGSPGSLGFSSSYVRIGNTEVTTTNTAAILIDLSKGFRCVIGRNIFVEPSVSGSPQKIVLGASYAPTPLSLTQDINGENIEAEFNGSIYCNRDIILQTATGSSVKFTGPFLKGSSGVNVPEINLTIGSDNNYGQVIFVGDQGATSGNIDIYAGTLKVLLQHENRSPFLNSPLISVGTSNIAEAILDISAYTASFNLLVNSSAIFRGKGKILLANNLTMTINGIFNPTMIEFSGNATTALSVTTKIELNGTSRGVGGYGAVDVTNNGVLKLGGVLQLEINSEFVGNSTLELFRADTVTSGSITDNFSSIIVSGNSSLSSLTFTLGANKLWTSSISSNNQYMTFDGNTGVLSIIQASS